MKINVVQVHEYMFKGTDTLRVLQGFAEAHKQTGEEIILVNRGGVLYAQRYENN